jgi:hypothetical protein
MDFQAALLTKGPFGNFGFKLLPAKFGRLNLKSTNFKFQFHDSVTASEILLVLILDPVRITNRLPLEYADTPFTATTTFTPGLYLSSTIYDT